MTRRTFAAQPDADEFDAPKPATTTQAAEQLR
jgi:hypothetical protein